MSDIVERARKHEECVRLEGCENHDLILEMAAEIERLRLLSSPRVEDVRREALEEAAKVADEVAAHEHEEKISDKETEGDDYDPYSYGAGFLDGSWVTAQNLAKAIRALSLPVKDKP